MHGLTGVHLIRSPPVLSREHLAVMNKPFVSFPELLARAAALADQFALTAGYHDETGKFPFANFDDLYQAGLLALTTSRDHGGFGFGLQEASTVVSEIARGDPSTALVLAMHYSNHHAIRHSGKWPEHLVTRVALANRDGVALINAAQVEPRIGSPSHGALPETIARRDGNRWLISGHKIYTTGIPILTWAVVLAVTDEAQPRLASFLVPVDAPGFSIKETWNATGMRATASHDIILDNVPVPLDDIIDPQPASEGLKRDETIQAWYFALIASVYHGVARAAGEWSIDFAARYAPGSLGTPIATLPRVQDSLGDIEIRLTANERLLRSLADDVDAGRPIGTHAAIIKHLVVDNAIAITSAGLDLGGNPGLSRSNAIERHHRNALCARAHAPQNNMIRVIAGKAALSRSESGKAVAPKSSALHARPSCAADGQKINGLEK